MLFAASRCVPFIPSRRALFQPHMREFRLIEIHSSTIFTHQLYSLINIFRLICASFARGASSSDSTKGRLALPLLDASISGPTTHGSNTGQPPPPQASAGDIVQLAGLSKATVADTVLGADGRKSYLMKYRGLRVGRLHDQWKPVAPCSVRNGIPTLRKELWWYRQTCNPLTPGLHLVYTCLQSAYTWSKVRGLWFAYTWFTLIGLRSLYTRFTPRFPS